jgi:hypothetical protein
MMFKEKRKIFMKKRIALAGALGAGGLAYLLTRTFRSKGPREGKQNEQETASRTNIEAPPENNPRTQDYETDQFVEDQPLDDRGTDRAQASNMLRSIRDQAFEGSDEKLALALGRPTDEIEQWASGAGEIDGDIVLKARSLANLRGINIEQGA